MHSEPKFIFAKWVLLCCSLSAFAAGTETVSLSGKVLKTSGKPLKKCIVSLRNLKMKDTTDSDGYYSFSVDPSAAVLNDIASHEQSGLSLSSTRLTYTVSQTGSLCLSLLDLKGQKLHSWKSGMLSAGNHVFPLSEVIPNSIGRGMYIIQLKTEREVLTFRCLKTGNGLCVMQKSGSAGVFGKLNGALAKNATVVDTIDFKATGYQSKAYTISKYVMNCQDVTLEEEEDEYEFEPETLTPSILKGKWACIFYDQDGCEEYVSINNFNITNMYFSSFVTDQVFSGSWGTYELAGAILDEENLLLICSREDAVFNSQDIRIIALTQSHPNEQLAGSVFSGTGTAGRYNLTTGAELCTGSFSIMMVRDFTDIGGTSNSSGSTYNPETSGFESNQNDCLKKYLNCSKACSIGNYGIDATSRYSACIAECDEERDECER